MADECKTNIDFDCQFWSTACQKTGFPVKNQAKTPMIFRASCSLHAFFNRLLTLDIRFVMRIIIQTHKINMRNKPNRKSLIVAMNISKKIYIGAYWQLLKQQRVAAVRFLRVVLFLAFFHAKAAVLYVNLNSPNPTPPYVDWSTAATDIQSAIDAANVGDRILVTNGIYNTGGRVVTGSLLNRVVVSKALTVQSVNGPKVTIIQGAQVPVTIIGEGATRCVYLTNSATLTGFTLTNGATRGMLGSSTELYGGGIYCRSASAVVSNCVVTGNAATIYGGGGYQGTYYNCNFIGNSATNGGGTSLSILSNCLLLNNTAFNYGAGAYSSSLTGCTVATNYGSSYGGGVYLSYSTNCAIWGNTSINGGGASYGTLVNCTLVSNFATNGGGIHEATAYNCIIYYNQAPNGSNSASATLNYCCTMPQHPGSGNFTNNPQLSDYAHITANSPCRGVGSNVYTYGNDIDGETWSNPPSIGCDEYNTNALGDIAIAVNGNNYTATGLSTTYSGLISGHARNYLWNFGDGILASNTFYPTHYWTNAGNYAVTLTAYNDSHPSGVQFSFPVLVVTQLLYYVKPANTNSQPPYLSWATAATNIQTAINIALPATGATILVTNGTYGPINVSGPFLISSINGAQYTLIDGNNSRHCVQLGIGANLNGFTLTNGYAGYPYYAGAGAGVSCASTNNIISNCMIVSNHANSAYGGGAYNGTLINCTILKNVGVSSGSGLSEGAGAYGCILSNCVITLNTSDNSGGGVESCTLFNCTLSSNNCTGSYSGIGGGGGGADYCTLYNCYIFSNNTTLSGGGANYSILAGCIVTNNTPSGAENSVLTNCLIFGNRGSKGGLVFCTVYSSTIVSNSFNQGYGGAGVYGSTVNNCILYYNDGFTNDGYSSFNYCCTSTSPQNGINNYTNAPLFINISAGNFHLQSNSPCINSGANFYNTTSVDLDGNPRIKGGTIDAGAYELQTPKSILSYAWAQQYGFLTDGTADSLDLDGTGMKNWQKSLAGLNPTNRGSILAMLPNLYANGVGSTVSWQSVSNRFYYLLRSTNVASIASFTAIQSNIVGQAGSTSYTDTTATNFGPYFYRIGIQ